jgi:UDP-N-acetylglucosamine 2-epimerase (non-hydrolysing)
LSIKKILLAVGARPNFIKITEFRRVVREYPDIELKIVHTGQHFDIKMADVFFQQLNIVPDYFLHVPPASPNTQIAEIMLRLEKLVVADFKPDLILVVGDVNSTLAIALTANKLGIRLGHIESGLRSNDFSMPEEINRILTDNITDYFFITEQSGYDNLLKEGKRKDCLFMVGNTMIDALVAKEKEIRASDVLDVYGLTGTDFILMTMHRPATVDSEKGLTKLLELVRVATNKLKLIIPMHPRTLSNLEKFNLLGDFKKNKNVIITEPLDYFSFQKLILHCKLILTDSGGIQEESTFRKVPCLTFRPNTERPVTCLEGTNTLVPFDAEEAEKFINDIINGSYKTGKDIELWDGLATKRIVEIISKL